MYYNAEMRKILTSQNYHFLSSPTKDTPPEEIEVAPDTPLEGESKGSTLPMSKQSDSSKRKRVEEDTVPPDLNEPRKMRRIKTNYRYLNDPFPDEEKEEEQIQLTSAERIFVTFTETQLGGDEPRTLEEAKWSPKWPEWEHAVQTELAQL
jgi:hypothetical protein